MEIECRTAFEEWVKNNTALYLSKEDNGSYSSMYTHTHWQGWKAAWNTLTHADQPPDIGLLDPDMPAQELRLHMGELTAQEERTARAAIRWANSYAGGQPERLMTAPSDAEVTTPDRQGEALIAEPPAPEHAKPDDHDPRGRMTAEAWAAATSSPLQCDQPVKLPGEVSKETLWWLLTDSSAEAQQAFMANWLRGLIRVPDEVMLRIWLSENGKRGLAPNLHDPSPMRESIDADTAFAEGFLERDQWAKILSEAEWQPIETVPRCGVRIYLKNSQGEVDTGRWDHGDITSDQGLGNDENGFGYSWWMPLADDSVNRIAALEKGIAAIEKEFNRVVGERDEWEQRHKEQRREIAELRGGWQPIELVPTDTWVIVDRPLFSGRRIAILIDETDKGYGQTWFDEEMEALEGSPTRWMPLPNDNWRRGRDA